MRLISKGGLYSKAALIVLVGTPSNNKEERRNRSWKDKGQRSSQ